ncbi:MAG: hypothetical protein ACK5YO_04505, partial [Planctomyces sp.]
MMKLDTNFEKLRPIGVDVDVFALLQINTTNTTHVETLTLPGQAEGGGDLTETYTLAPNLFAVQAAGKLNFHVPDGNEDNQFGDQLFRLSGVFSIEISPSFLKVFVMSNLQLGPEDLRLLDLQAVGVFILNPDGFAMDLEVTANAGL